MAIYYVLSPRQLFSKYVFFGHSLGSVSDRANLSYSHVFLRHSHGKCYNGHSPKFYLLHRQRSPNLFNQSSRLAIRRPSLLPDPTASSSDTPTAKVRTATALNYTCFTCGVRHLLPILTVGNPAAILYYLSSPRHLFYHMSSSDTL